MFYSCEKSFWENIWYSHWEIFILFTIQECDSVAKPWYPISALLSMGVARIFQRGGHTESYRGYLPDCLLNNVGCLLTKRLTKGESHAPQDPPGYALAFYLFKIAVGVHYIFSSCLPSKSKFCAPCEYLHLLSYMSSWSFTVWFQCNLL